MPARPPVSVVSMHSARQEQLNIGPAAAAIATARREGRLGEYRKGVVITPTKFSNGHIHLGKDVLASNHPYVQAGDFTDHPIVDFRLVFYYSQWRPPFVTVNADGSGGSRNFGKSRNIDGTRVFDCGDASEKTTKKTCAFPCPCGGWSHFVHVKRLCWRMVRCEVSDAYPQGQAVALGWVMECMDCKKAGRPYCFRSFNNEFSHGAAAAGEDNDERGQLQMDATDQSAAELLGILAGCLFRYSKVSAIEEKSIKNQVAAAKQARSFASIAFCVMW